MNPQINEISIVKTSGKVVKFSLKKLKRSLKRTGADAVLIAQILQTVQNELYEGISTKEIYNRAFALIKKGEKCICIKI